MAKDKPICNEPGCHGTGTVWIIDRKTGKSILVSCPRCGGVPK